MKNERQNISIMAFDYNGTNSYFRAFCVWLCEMTPKEKLKEIKEAGLGLVDPDKYWLVSRVEQLERSLDLCLYYMRNSPLVDKQAVGVIEAYAADLNTGPEGK